MRSAKPAFALLTTLCITGSLGLSSAARAQTHYAAIDLTALGGAYIVNGLTSNNAVVGDAGGHGFLYDQTGFHDVGALVPGGGTQAYAANSKGQVVGYGDIDSPATVPPHAFLYDSTGIHELPLLSGGNYSFAQAINDNDIAVGFSTNDPSDIASTFHAVYWDSAGIHDLGNYGSYAGAIAINNSNQILIAAGNDTYLHDATGDHFVQTNGGTAIFGYALGENGSVGGYITDSSGNLHAALYDSTGGYDLGVLTGGTTSAGYGISDTGLVIGDADTASGGIHAFAGDRNGLIDLGALAGDESHAFGVNKYGQVVGYSSDGAGGTLGFFYTGGQMYDLNGLIDNLNGFTFDFAGQINNNGYIIGSGHDAFGNEHNFLLAPVPEPSSLALLASGVLSGAAFLRRRQRGK